MASLSFMTKALSGHPSNRVIESLSNQNSLPTKEVVEEANSEEIPPAWVAEYASFAKDETTKSTSGALSRSVLLFCFIAGLIGLIISSLQIYEGEACFPLKDTTKCEPFTSKILGNSGPNVYTTVFSSSAGIPYLSEEEIIIFKGGWPKTASVLHLTSCSSLLVFILMTYFEVILNKYASLLLISLCALFLSIVYYDFFTILDWKKECSKLTEDLYYHFRTNMTSGLLKCSYARYQFCLLFFVVLTLAVFVMASEKPLSIAWKKVKKEHNDEEQLHAIQEFVLYREDLASVTPYKRM